MEPTVLEQTFPAKREELLAELNKLTRDRDVLLAENKAIADSTISLKTYEQELQYELQNLRQEKGSVESDVENTRKALTHKVDSLNTLSHRLENEISSKKGILAQLSESIDKFTESVANSLEVSGQINTSIPKAINSIEKATGAILEQVNICTKTVEHFVNDIMAIERQQNAIRAALNEKELQLNNRETALNVIAENNVLPQ